MGWSHRSAVSGGTAAIGLLKREDCKRTKHDSVFSDWKILIGPSDWEDYSLRKEGSEKYRTHNLPNCASCSGLYELGVAVSLPQLGREAGRLSSKRIIPVYLGQADNVRNRLQQYGRDGAHLQNGCPHDDPNDVKGLGLFSEIFLKGYAIVYRWAPMPSKKDAEKTEARLLNIFDYAWNKEMNGVRRSRDIHQKIDCITSSTTRRFIFAKLHFFHQRKVGLRIKRCEPVMLDNKGTNDIFSRIFRFSRSRPTLISKEFGNKEGDSNSSICGVALGRGSICTISPVEGRKRCAEHKGRKINGFTQRVINQRKQSVDGEINANGCSSIYGFDLGNEAVCTRKIVLGRKRCEKHKGMSVKVQMPKCLGDNTLSHPVLSRSFVQAESCSTCVAIKRDGSFCRRRPGNGSKWCWQHERMALDSCSSSLSVPA